MNPVIPLQDSQADSPARVIGLIEYLGAAEVLALRVGLRVVRGGANHLHHFVIVVLEESRACGGMDGATKRCVRLLHMFRGARASTRSRPNPSPRWTVRTSE